MAYADLDGIQRPSTGTNSPIASWGAQVNDNFANLANAWTSYTPAWTASTNPAIGNGTLAGRYVLMNKRLDLRIRMTAGSTTTFGSGAWAFSLPGSLVTSASGNQLIPALAQQSSTVFIWHGNASLATSAATFVVLLISGANGSASSTVPFAWASGDELRIQGTIELT